MTEVCLSCRLKHRCCITVIFQPGRAVLPGLHIDPARFEALVRILLALIW